MLDTKELEKEIAVLTDKLKKSEESTNTLKGHIIIQAIKRNKLLKGNVIFADVVAEEMSKRFEVKMQGDAVMIKGKDNFMSLDNPARPATTDESVTQLLNNRYRQHLIPERKDQPVAAATLIDKKPQQQSGQISILLTQYNDAKAKGQHTVMVSLKRRLHELGRNIL